MALRAGEPLIATLRHGGQETPDNHLSISEFSMISKEQNELMTRVGPGTPAGKLLRRYWQPVALAEELSGLRPLKAVKLMGQEFVLFRDENGQLGLLDRDCPHRGADLSFGRLEHGGLRCPFHGWLFDVSGTCLETPPSPPAASSARAPSRLPIRS
jgi:nitrite reductase/ring-hydroxylating ferredoxin subunit